MNKSMHTCRIAALTCCIFVILLAPTTLLAAAERVIKISGDPWEPWVFGKEGGKATNGWSIDIANELFQRLGINTDINIYPYERCIRQMKSGERDMLLMAKKTEERKKFLLYTDISVADPQLLYYATERTKSFEWSDWSDLKQHTVGGVRGFNYGEFHNAAKKHDIKIELTESDLQNVKKLLSGRIDLVMLSRSTARYFFSTHPEFRNKLQAARKPVANAEFFLALSKKGSATDLLPDINRVLVDMKNDGTLNKIIESTD